MTPQTSLEQPTLVERLRKYRGGDIQYRELMDEAAARIEGLELALRRIAEGNLGDCAWQANYTRIREVAREALSSTGGGGD